MSQRNRRVRIFSLAGAAVFGASLMLFQPSSIVGQTPGSSPTPSPPSLSNSDKSDSRPELGNAENEMRARLALKAAKKEYDENVARAREASELASQLEESYRAKKTLTSEDWKKADRLEKLTKRIRNEAGGSDSRDEVKDLPEILESAVKQVAEWADDLKKEVEKTPRHVVSAAVIDQANKLIGLIQHLRDLTR